MNGPMLRELYEQLPQPRPSDDPEDWAVRMRSAFTIFRERVIARYTEGTVQRLLSADDVNTRRAAVLALGLIGTMAGVGVLAESLRDEDALVQTMAADALWEIWFRGEDEAAAAELQRIAQLRNPRQMLLDLDALIRRAPTFAEAINQRAIVHFRIGDYHRSIEDCRKTLQLNPHHFGAQAGMGQCYLKIRSWRDALHAFELALAINPGMDGVEDNIRQLREAIGEEPAD